MTGNSKPRDKSVVSDWCCLVKDESDGRGRFLSIVVLFCFVFRKIPWRFGRHWRFCQQRRPDVRRRRGQEAHSRLIRASYNQPIPRPMVGREVPSQSSVVNDVDVGELENSFTCVTHNTSPPNLHCFKFETNLSVIINLQIVFFFFHITQIMDFICVRASKMDSRNFWKFSGFFSPSEPPI